MNGGERGSRDSAAASPPLSRMAEAPASSVGDEFAAASGLTSSAMSALDVLRCPITRSRLERLDDDDVAEFNQRVRDGQIVRSDESVLDGTEPTALVATPGREYFYEIRGGVYLLLPGLAFRSSDDEHSVSSMSPEKLRVRTFYETVGWELHDNETYVDTVIFEDLRPVSRDYTILTRRRVADHLAPAGRFLLDVASGPVQFDEYRDYSANYQYRICADISMAALKEAQRRLGDHGVYVLCDLITLPLQDDSIDAVVSLHTLYHVPYDEQLAGFRQLRRVLAPNRTGVVVYSWEFPSAMMAPFHPISLSKRMVRRLASEKVVNRVRSRLGRGADDEQLYFRPHSRRWVEENVCAALNADLACWRSVATSFQTRFIHERLGGRWLMKALAAAEARFPHLFARIGQYPMIVFRAESAHIGGAGGTT